MKNIAMLQFIFFSFVFIISIIYIIYVIKNDEGIDYTKWIRIYNDEKEKSLKKLDEGNKEINRIEKEILKYKKKLKMKLFD